MHNMKSEMNETKFFSVLCKVKLDKIKGESEWGFEKSGVIINCSMVHETL